MVKMVLFSPGSVSSPYTNTGFSEKVNVFQVSPSLVLYLRKKRSRMSAVGKFFPAPGQPLAPARGQPPLCLPYLSWSVSVPCAMATRMPPWSPQV